MSSLPSSLNRKNKRLSKSRKTDANQDFKTTPVPTPPNHLPLGIKTDASRHSQRIESVMRGIWAKIPANDQLLMLKEIATYREGKFVVEIECNWEHRRGTNAMIWPRFGLTIVDGGYVDAADDHHIASTLAHELGHLRGFADPSGPDLTEETANHFQQNVWGFPPGEVIFKCEVCRSMEEILQTEGIFGDILWHSGWFSFVYVPPNKRLELGTKNYELLTAYSWASAEALLIGEVELADSSTEVRRRYARYLKRTTRFKSWEESLRRMGRRYLPLEQD